MSHADSYSYSYSDDAYVFCVVEDYVYALVGSHFQSPSLQPSFQFDHEHVDVFLCLSLSVEELEMTEVVSKQERLIFVFVRARRYVVYEKSKKDRTEDRPLRDPAFDRPS